MLVDYQNQKFNAEGAKNISRELVHVFKKRRTIRNFSSRMVDVEILKNAIEVAGCAPSGANKQPWHFIIVSDQALKSKIRNLAEKEEYEFYHQRKNEAWLNDLKHLHTNHKKAFIEQAPYHIVIFYRHIDKATDGDRQNYYAKESTGIATGMLLSALHLAGLSTLTYTPSRMKFLASLFERPKHERPFLFLSVGHPHPDAKVPVLTKKTLGEISNIYL